MTGEIMSPVISIRSAMEPIQSFSSESIEGGNHVRYELTAAGHAKGCLRLVHLFQQRQAFRLELRDSDLTNWFLPSARHRWSPSDLLSDCITSKVVRYSSPRPGPWPNGQ